MSRGRVQAQLEVASKRGSEKRITKGATPVAGGGTHRCAGRRKRPLVLFDGSPWRERAGAVPRSRPDTIAAAKYRALLRRLPYFSHRMRCGEVKRQDDDSSRS